MVDNNKNSKKLNWPERIASLIYERNKFYYLCYRNMIFVFILILLCIFASLFSIYYINYNYDSIIYFSTDKEGRLLENTSLEVPVLSDEEILSWTEDAISKIYRLNYVSSTVSFQENYKFFTPLGYINTFNALVNTSKNLETIQAINLVIQGQACQGTKIVSKGVQSYMGTSTYTWKLEVPGAARYLNATQEFTSKPKISVVIRRLPFVLAPKGIAISSLIVYIQQDDFFKGDMEFEQLCQVLYPQNYKNT
tara:strand:- start:10999 stop:11751 length:753 start_codon:yes stop_codon:yes gene_type:complete